MDVISTRKLAGARALQWRLERIEAGEMVAVDMGQEARKWRAKAWDGSEEIDCDPSAMNFTIDAGLQTSNVGELLHHSPEGRHLTRFSTSGCAVEAVFGKIEVIEG